MKKSIWSVATVAIALMLCAVAFHAQARESDEAEIKTLYSNFNAAIQAKDIDAIMKNYVPGESLVVFDVIPPRQYVGSDAYTKNWHDFLGSMNGPVKVDTTEMQIASDGKLAYAHYIQHITGTGTDGKPFELTLRWTDVLRKTNGKWLIVHEHISVPVDVATGKADLSSKP